MFFQTSISIISIFYIAVCYAERIRDLSGTYVVSLRKLVTKEIEFIFKQGAKI